MSNAIVCDHCKNALAVDKNREDVNGESAAWLTLGLGGERYDLCTRACVVAFLERPEVVEAHDAQYEAIADIARMIRDERDSA